MLLLRLPIGAVYLWTATEACIQFRMSKRRERLGISDPVVTNRLALWAMYAFVAASSVVISTTLHAQGRGPLDGSPTTTHDGAFGPLVFGRGLAQPPMSPSS